MSENTSASAARMAAYKNNSKNSTELRQRRHEVSVELRKNKKEDQMLKRRNIEIQEPPSPLQESNGQSPVAMMTLEEVMVNIQNPPMQFAAVQSVRKLLSRERNPPIDIVIDQGLVPVLVHFLKDFSNSAIQFEASWALTNIASGSSEQTKTVINANAVPCFIELLRSPVANVAEQAVWALGNVAGDGPEARDIVLELGVVDQLLWLLEKVDLEISFRRNVVWLMSNLCRNKNPTPPFHMVKKMLPALVNLLEHDDRAILSDVCWALSYATDDTPEKIQAVVDSGCVPRLVQLLDCDDVGIVTPALRSIGNIVTGDDRQTDAVLAANVLPYIEKLLAHKKNNIVKEAAWTLSNITAGNQQQIQKVLDYNILGQLVQILGDGDFKTQREAVWAITNITSGGSNEQIIQMIEKYAVIKPYCELLLAKDVRTVGVVLSGLATLFKVAESVNGLTNFCIMLEEIGTIDKLEALQNHENMEIYEKAYQIIEAYFNDEADEEKEVAPSANAETFEFNNTQQQNGHGKFQF